MGWVTSLYNSSPFCSNTEFQIDKLENETILYPLSSPPLVKKKQLRLNYDNWTVQSSRDVPVAWKSVTPRLFVDIFFFFHCKITFHFQTPGYWCVSKNNSQWQKEALDQNQVTAKISFCRTVPEWLEEHITKRQWDMMCPEELAKIQTFQFRKSTSVFWFENSRLSVLWSPP